MNSGSLAPAKKTGHQADPGQVVPGTQKPIVYFYVVSLTEPNPKAHECLLDGLAALLRGTEKAVDTEYAVFTDLTSADQFAERQGLLNSAIGRLRLLSAEQLAEIAPALSPTKVNETIDLLNRYSDYVD
jgi:hypothetical protein